MSELDLSVLRSTSFGGYPDKRADWSVSRLMASQWHAQDLVGSPEQPSSFSRLAEIALSKIPFDGYDCPQPLPNITGAIVFTTARQAVPYGDAFVSFWQTFAPKLAKEELPRIDIVDPSIHKGHSKDYQSTQATQHNRIAQLAEEIDTGHTMAYVFDEFMIEGRALRRGMKIVREAGFRYVSKLPLYPSGRDDGVYINFEELPFDRDGPHNELVPNENPQAVAALRHDMQLLGRLAAENYGEFLDSRAA